MAAFYSKSISGFTESGRKITLIGLALPLLVESTLLQLYTTANTFLLKGYSMGAVTAVSVSDTVLNIAIVLITMVIKGTVIMSSFALGSQDRHLTARIYGTAWIVIMGIAVLSGGMLMIFARQFSVLMNLKGQIAVEAAVYLQVRATFLPITALMSYLNNLLICHGCAKKSMIVGVVGNILNIVFCYIALYTDIKLPCSGVTVVAICCVLSQFFSVILSAIFFIKAKCPIKICFENKIAGRIFTLGIPSGMCLLSFALSQTFTTGFITSLGDVIINAKVYISNIVLYTSRISLAVGNATGILMGRFRGRGDMDKIHKLFGQNVRICLICNLTFSCLAYVFHRQLIGLFTNNQTIITLSASIMLIDILIEALRGVNHVAENSLNANGDVKTTFIISVMSTWLIGVFVSYVLGIVCGAGLVGIWIAFAADEILRASAYCLRWKRGKWKKTVILKGVEE